MESDNFLNEIRIYNYDSQNISDNFKYSIRVNELFETQIRTIGSRILLNAGKFYLSYFNLKFIEIFEKFARKHEMDTTKSDLINLSNSITSYMNKYFDELDTNLNIKNNDDLEELKYILNISYIFLKGSIEDDDVELAFESFYQLEDRIKSEDLCNYNNTFNYKNDEIELNISFKTDNEKNYGIMKYYFEELS